jgi:hypothetical protein
LLNDQSGLVVGDSTVFSWVGCHTCGSEPSIVGRELNNCE